ncbi:MAG: anti-sigma factor [Thermoleophilaceae bacterium]|nr:anti-sigma factor [Thermoleophilaceae bacterium]
MERKIDISDYLLGELTDAERAEFETQLASDPQLAAEVAGLGDVVAKLEAAPVEVWDELEVPALDMSLFVDSSAPVAEDAVTSAPAFEPAPVHQERESVWKRFFAGGVRLNPAFAGLAVVAIFAGGIAFGFAADSGQTGGGTLVKVNPNEQEMTLKPVSALDPGARGEMWLNEKKQTMRFKLTGLAHTQEGHFYEAWMMNGNTRGVSLGSFKPDKDGTVSLTVPVPVNEKDFPTLAITLESADGNTAPSSEAILTSPL